MRTGGPAAILHDARQKLRRTDLLPRAKVTSALQLKLRRLQSSSLLACQRPWDEKETLLLHAMRPPGDSSGPRPLPGTSASTFSPTPSSLHPASLDSAPQGCLFGQRKPFPDMLVCGGLLSRSLSGLHILEQPLGGSQLHRTAWKEWATLSPKLPACLLWSQRRALTASAQLLEFLDYKSHQSQRYDMCLCPAQETMLGFSLGVARSVRQTRAGQRSGEGQEPAAASAAAFKVPQVSLPFDQGLLPGRLKLDPSLANIPLTPETQRDQERRIRREIANSNERRRMQSINAGFQSLKTLIPHTDGEKLSKAAILQQTAEYIFSLEQEKTRLLQQNAQLKRFIQEFSGSSPKRRRAEDKDEGIGSPDIWEDEKAEDLRREMIELRQQLDKERSVRMMLEEQVRSLEAHMYPEKLKVIAQQVQLQQQQEQVRLLHREKQSHAQLLPMHGPPAPTHHPTVIVPAPPPSHHVTVVTMGPSSVINTISTSRQNLDTIVQAIQHIEGTQDKQLLEDEEQRRRAVIVTPARAGLDPSNSDTASDSEGEDSEAAMEHSKAEMP
nr:transcription factor AP-4 [Pogona vitticeps]